MFAVIKFFIAFSFSFVLLSIPIQEKPIFYYLNEWARPITKEIFSSSRSAILEGVKETKTIGKKMFNNTRPKEDEISTTSSSLDKHSHHESIDEEMRDEIEGIKHSDEFTDEEKNMLNQILIQAR
jgi:nicotinamide mononucleotide adenylyltransferase